MSILSAQCERLRSLANNMRQTSRGHKEYISAMRDAADTIWQLRNTNLDTANENDNLKAENEELREKGARLFDKTLELATENAKLRELVRDYYIHEHRDCDSCHFYDDCHSVGRASRAPFCIAPIRLGERARELGVEVG